MNIHKHPHSHAFTHIKIMSDAIRSLICFTQHRELIIPLKLHSHTQLRKSILHQMKVGWQAWFYH